MMQFGVSAIIMIYELPEDGYQTALALLSLVMLFFVTTLYSMIKTILLKRLPGRQLVSCLQRILTCLAITLLSKFSAQVIVLFWIQILALTLLFPFRTHGFI